MTSNESEFVIVGGKDQRKVSEVGITREVERLSGRSVETGVLEGPLMPPAELFSGGGSEPVAADTALINEIRRLRKQLSETGDENRQLLRYMEIVASSKVGALTAAGCDNTEELLRECIRSSHSETDGAFWAHFASYVAGKETTLADQLLFMNYTIALFPSETSWVWETAADKEAVMARLVDRFKRGRFQFEILYNSIAAQEYRGQTMPRDIAASVLLGAWGRILSLWNTARQQEFPPHLVPMIVATDVQSGMNREEYELCYAARNLLYARLSTDSVPSLVSPETLELMPDAARNNLQAGIDRLLATLSSGDYFKLPSGESVQDTRVSCLAESVQGLSKGTVVYVRVTDKATLYFILPYIKVNLNAGRARMTALASRSPDTPQPLSVSPVKSSESELALALLAKLVALLPQPWGSVATFSLTLTKYLFGDDGAKITQHTFDQLEANMKAFILQHDVTVSIEKLSNFTDWFVQQSIIMNETFADEPSLLESFLRRIEDQINPGGDLFEALPVFNRENVLAQAGGVDQLVAFSALYLLVEKTVISLDALLASLYYQAKEGHNYRLYTNKWLSDFDRFEMDVEGRPGQVRGIIPPIKDILANYENHLQRLKQIGPLYRTSQWQFHGSANRLVGGWAWKDSHPGISDSEHFFADTQEGCCGSTTVQHKETAERERNAYITKVTNGIINGNDYDAAEKATESIASDLEGWHDHLPPLMPKGAVVDLKTWEAIDKPVFAKGTQLRYAVQFTNDKGPSRFSSLSTPMTVEDPQQVPVLQIPIDPLGMADNRLLWRGTENSLVLLDTIKNNTDTSYVDKLSVAKG